MFIVKIIAYGLLVLVFILIVRAICGPTKGEIRQAQDQEAPDGSALRNDDIRKSYKSHSQAPFE